ncbi:MAG: MATE family efflux transporter [Candidatus Coproplasma sp.]
MTKVKRQKKTYTLFTGKQLLWLILPIVIEQIFSTSLGLFDSMMVSGIDSAGNVGNAVANVDQINNLIIQLFSAFATGGAIITSQYIGAKDYDKASQSAKHVLVVVSIVSLAICALCLALNNPLLKLFFGGVSREVHESSRIYFYVTAASFPFIGIFNACAALLRAQRKSVFNMISAALSCVLNVGVNALLIYVAHMGVLGAAIATLVCRSVPAVLMFCLLLRKKNVVRINLFEKFRFDGGMVKHILKIAIPSGIESALFQLGKLLTVTFVNIGYYNSPVLDAMGNPVLNDKGEIIYRNIQANGNSIAMNLNNIGSVVGGGVGTSCLTVIGQAVGTGDVEQCKYYMKKMFLISFIANAICVAVIMGTAHWLVRLYTYPEEAYDIALKCLYTALSFQFVTYPLSFTTPGILKATSDVKYVMWSAIISMALMRVGLCFVLTTDLLPFRLGAMGFWIGMCSDWVLRSILFMSRLLSGRWKRSSGLFKEKAVSCAGADGSTVIEGAEGVLDGTAEVAIDGTDDGVQAMEDAVAANAEEVQNNNDGENA